MHLRALTLCTFILAILSISGAAHAKSIPDKAIVYLQCTTLKGALTKGSGVVFTEKGHVLTAEHVAPQGSTCKGRLGRADEPPTRPLNPRETSDQHDFAVLQFNPAFDDNFEQINVAPKIEGFDQKKIVAVGYPSISDPVTRRAGTIASVVTDGDGLFDIGTDTAIGMSGGPIFNDETLVGLVARGEFDKRGLVARKAGLASDYFYETVTKIRADIKADEREAALSGLYENLLADDVCTELLRGPVFDRYANLFPPEARSGLEEPPNHLAKDAPFWVTITTGTANWLDCKEQTMAKSLYFPMGLLLKPYRDVVVLDEFDEEQTWTVFETEYGMLVLIDRRAVAPVTEHTGYIFPDALVTYKVCGPQDPPDCDPGLALPPLNYHRDSWPLLSPRDAYLYTTDVAGLTALATAHKAFKRNRAQIDDAEQVGRQLPVTFTERAPKTLDEDPACKPQEAYLYRFFQRFDPTKEHNNSQYPVPVSFSMCTTPPASAELQLVLPRALKIVTLSAAKRAFALRWQIALQLSADPVSAQVMRYLDNYPFAEPLVVRCSAASAEVRDLTITADKLGFSLRDVAEETTFQVVADLEPNFSYRSKHYRSSPGRSKSETLRKSRMFHEVHLKVFCGDDRKPKRAHEIAVHMDNVFLEPIVLNAIDIENWYLNNYAEYGFNDRIYIDDGHLERICDYTEYYGWRRTLEKFLTQSVPLKDISKTRLRVETQVAAEHFAHLILATLFLNEAEMQTDDNQAEGCI